MSDLNAFSLVPNKNREYHVFDMDSYMASSPHDVRTLTADNFDGGMRRIVSAMKALWTAHQMDDLCKVWEGAAGYNNA